MQNLVSYLLHNISPLERRFPIFYVTYHEKKSYFPNKLSAKLAYNRSQIVIKVLLEKMDKKQLQIMLNLATASSGGQWRKKYLDASDEFEYF